MVAFTAVLFVPALWSYFGLTGPAAPAFTFVLPALVLWFVTLSAAYRFGCSTAYSASADRRDGCRWPVRVRSSRDTVHDEGDRTEVRGH